MKNPLWVILWLIILILVAFFVAGFCATWYIIIYPLTVCVPDIAVVTDFLLKAVQFPHFCAKNMMEGTPLF
ncbi:unnamed protein product [Diamesa hyperborea]